MTAFEKLKREWREQMEGVENALKEEKKLYWMTSIAVKNLNQKSV